MTVFTLPLFIAANRTHRTIFLKLFMCSKHCAITCNCPQKIHFLRANIYEQYICLREERNRQVRFYPMFAEDIKIPVGHSFSVLCKYVVTIVYIILIHKTILFQQMWRKEKNRHIIIHFSDTR